MAVPPIVSPPVSAPSPGTLWSPYQRQPYPVPGETVVVNGNAYGNLPRRAVYGPSASPLDFPYHGFPPSVAYTEINPYPLGGSYSYTPSGYSSTSRFRRWR